MTLLQALLIRDAIAYCQGLFLGLFLGALDG